VISLSSAESEFHGMVSGRCDEYSSNVMQSSFCSFSVRHFPWTENNAARQLVPRQGVGRTRHLCGRILRIQQAVFFWRRCRFPPWGNTVTLAHIGTKCLPRGRLFFFFPDIFAVDIGGPCNLRNDRTGGACNGDLGSGSSESGDMSSFQWP
jgi:hypothetical protein